MKQATSGQCVHWAIAKVARELAGSWYDESAHDNDFFKFYPNENLFIEREYPRFIPLAREMMGNQLGDPKIPECQKEDIYEALMLDRTTPKKKLKPIRAQKFLH